jgi:AraC-like DNA-binding protein
VLAEVIAAYVTEREEFQLCDGYQPTNSLFYLLEGRFQLEIEKKEEIVQAGDVAIFDPYTHMRRRALAPLRFLYIKYSTKSSAMTVVPSGRYHNLSERAREDLTRLLQLSESHTPHAPALQRHYLNDLLLSLLPTREGGGTQSEGEMLPRELARSIAYLREHLAEKLSLDRLARISEMSVSSLESKFKTLMGASPYRYLITLRMEHATRLLCETAYSVTEIATRCGYDNLFYFCNAFKKEIGITPSQYREQNRI